MRHDPRLGGVAGPIVHGRHPPSRQRHPYIERNQRATAPARCPLFGFSTMRPHVQRAFRLQRACVNRNSVEFVALACDALPKQNIEYPEREDRDTPKHHVLDCCRRHGRSPGRQCSLCRAAAHRGRRSCLERQCRDKSPRRLPLRQSLQPTLRPSQSFERRVPRRVAEAAGLRLRTPPRELWRLQRQEWRRETRRWTSLPLRLPVQSGIRLAQP